MNYKHFLAIRTDILSQLTTINSEKYENLSYQSYCPEKF